VETRKIEEVLVNIHTVEDIYLPGIRDELRIISDHLFWTNRLILLVGFVLILVAFFFGFKPAHAQGRPLDNPPTTTTSHTPSYRISFGDAWGLGWDAQGAKKGEVTHLVPGVTMSFSIAVPVVNKLSWFADVLCYIPHNIFQPAPRFTTGASYFWKEVRLGLGFSIMDQINPGYQGKPVTNTFGVTIAPSVAITDNTSLGFGIGYRLTTSQMKVLRHSLALGPTITFKLPF